MVSSPRGGKILLFGDDDERRFLPLCRGALGPSLFPNGGIGNRAGSLSRGMSDGPLPMWLLVTLASCPPNSKGKLPTTELLLPGKRVSSTLQVSNCTRTGTALPCGTNDRSGFGNTIHGRPAARRPCAPGQASSHARVARRACAPGQANGANATGLPVAGDEASSNDI